MNLKLKAKAIVAVRRRKKLEAEAKIALEARESALIERLLAKVTLPIPKDGIDGRDAPTLSDIMAQIHIPEPTHTTVVQEVNPTDMEVFIRGLLPEIQPEDRPAVEQIIQETTIDVSDEKLEGFVSQEEFKKTLRKIQDAITANAGGGGALPASIVNIIEVAEDTTILDSQLLETQINIILVTVAEITVTLPASSVSKVVWVQQGYEGSGEFTVCKAT